MLDQERAKGGFRAAPRARDAARGLCATNAGRVRALVAGGFRAAHKLGFPLDWAHQSHGGHYGRGGLARGRLGGVS